MKLFASSRISIQTKIIFPYLILVLFLLIAVGYIGTQILFDSIQERFTNQLIDAGKLVTKSMVGEENEMLETLRLLANTNGVAEAITLNDNEALRLIALPVAVNDGRDVVIFLNRNGKAVLSLIHNTNSTLDDYLVLPNNTEAKNWDMTLQVLRGESDEYGDKFSGFETTSFGNYFFIAGPVRDIEGNFIGVVIVGESAEHIANALREETLAHITLYAPGGEVVATTFPASPQLDNATFTNILNTQAEQSLIRDIAYTDITYSEILGAWKARGDDIGVIGTAFAQNFFIRFSQQRWNLLLTSTLTALLLVIAVGIFISKNIGEPLQRLGQAAMQVSKGDLNVEVLPDGRDEIAELTQQFNSMVKTLYHSRQEIVTAYDDTILAWGKTLELYDIETQGHSGRVTELTLKLARLIGTSEEELPHIRRGALLHDIGKLTVPIQILRKPGALTESEIALMRTHPIAAYEILNGISFLKPALDIPFCHHENWDGSGYPRGLRGEEIPLSARIFSVVDVWDAVTTDRPYRMAMSRNEAIELLMKRSKIQFDPNIVEQFLKLI
jgi:HD-GYP domain-containing protein (c-di-GMP phosphodiesterase class II)